MMRFVLVLAFLWPLSAAAQTEVDPAALAEIRGELTALNAEIEALRKLLQVPNTDGSSPDPTGSAVLRLGQLEENLAQLTGSVETLRNRIDAVVADGTNRIGDLEFRLTELEGGDVSALGETPTLGGDVAVAAAPATATATTAIDTNDVELAVGERDAFEAAMKAYTEGDLEAAIALYDTYLQTYSGGPLSVQALYQKAEAQAALGQHKSAARSYLDTFTADPVGQLSAPALMKVGTSLGQLGQVDQACSTLQEVLNRYPERGEIVAEVTENQNALGCG